MEERENCLLRRDQSHRNKLKGTLFNQGSLKDQVTWSKSLNEVFRTEKMLTMYESTVQSLMPPSPGPCCWEDPGRRLDSESLSLETANIGSSPVTPSHDLNIWSLTLEPHREPHPYRCILRLNPGELEMDHL